jgi:hypothetical protein
MNAAHPSRREKDAGQYLWPEYYQAFPAFSAETVRIGCHPRKMVHSAGTEQAIVLVHGLTDSPYYMSAIGEYFHYALGYNVYIPLLQCHGLKSPAGMVGVALAEWLQNVGFAIRSAARESARVSIGGLSTGGALGYYLACCEPMITGDLYLFSAALGLPDGPFGIPGRFKEWLLRLPFIGKFASFSPLVGKNPYRYDRVSLNSAAELAKLMGKIAELSFVPGDTDRPARRTFAAWSGCDTVISLDKLRELQRLTPEGRFVPFIIPAAARVEHACVVLQWPIFALDAGAGAAPLEQANPRFSEMLAAIGRFAAAG